ncbi:hypothetical protein, partial [Mesorhizobium humile]|uniref:hypothetical protein n=1 Tax=Mesorhizobium humile TaxID=3072313 RepID=UPI002A23AC96
DDFLLCIHRRAADHRIGGIGIGAERGKAYRRGKQKSGEFTNDDSLLGLFSRSWERDEIRVAENLVSRSSNIFVCRSRVRGSDSYAQKDAHAGT